MTTSKMDCTAHTHTHTHTHAVPVFLLSPDSVSLLLLLQILSNRKGLLPEPNLAQLLTSMTNPAALQILMRPYHTGKRGGEMPTLEQN